MSTSEVFLDVRTHPRIRSTPNASPTPAPGSANEDAVGYALRLLRTAGLVINRKQGRVVYYRLADGFPEPLREHCLRQLIVLPQAPTPDEG